MGDHELVDWIENFFRNGFRELFAQHIFISFLTTVPLGIVSAVCEAVGRPTDAMKIMAGLGDVESAAPSMAMWDLGRLAASSNSVSAVFEAGIGGLDARLRATEEPECARFVDAFDQSSCVPTGRGGLMSGKCRAQLGKQTLTLALAAIDRMRVSPGSAAPEGPPGGSRSRTRTSNW